MSWVVYILECADQTLYTGITSDLEKRVASHANNTGAKYTRGRGPFKVLYQEICDGRSEATKRELLIKAMSREEKIALIDTSEK